MKAAPISFRSKPNALRALSASKALPLDEAAMKALVAAPPLGEITAEGQGTALAGPAPEDGARETPSFPGARETPSSVGPPAVTQSSPPTVSLVPAPSTPAAASTAPRPGRQQKDTPLRRADLGEDQLLRRLQVSLSAEVEEALRVLAAKERSSLSSLIEIEMRAMLTRRGALPPPTTTPR